MNREPKAPNRFAEIPRDKPMGERTEHANLDRPGAQAHPVARGWTHLSNPSAGWKR
ncbi:hypothetical protein [Caenimonas aquaedulcis]|uniref:Uncharacterized protein n=1 Tax=Caenimonas aquaedulcis TaxID=2793270 RepID=A0A931MIG1_9BURK|nr:hypothetical protein [Caenimonas aquaedulcis]MBG9389225.1 hypothetical protein [Caenimonas aquaedulcis]